MSTKQNKMMMNLRDHFSLRWLLMLMLTLQVFSVAAEEATINNLEFSSLAGNQLQIQLEMSGPVTEPKVFQTDNPSRIALDFEGVKSNLAKKSFPINQGAANTVYVVEASGRTRVVINLTEKVPYETKLDGNKYYVVLKSAGAVAAVNKIVQTSAAKETSLSRFLPEQAIKSIDFRRGPNGEGRLLLGLSTPNTVVDAKQSAGKVVLNFLNTKIPESLVKSFDVSDFATPVQSIEAVPRGESVNITITPGNPNYEYSSYQSDNLLTVEFRPLTPAEKEAQLREKQPYIGSKLSLNFQEIDVKAVLMILADHIKTQEGKEVNIITTDSVTGSIALHVNDVPWDQVLDVVMKLRGLSKRENGNVILVGPTEEIKVLEEKELEARRIYEQLEPLKTENIQINYARATDICNVLVGKGNFNQGGGPLTQSTKGGSGGSGGSSGGCGGTSSGSTLSSQQLQGGSGVQASDLRLISPRGAVIVDARTNTLIVKDTAKQLEEIHKMIAKLDVAVRQVLIESRIVIATTSFAQDIGTKFGVIKRGDALLMRGKGLSDTPDNTYGQGLEDGSDTSRILQDLGTALAASSGGSLALTLARGADYLLNLEISALQDDGKGELVSNPRVMTQDRVPATIKQGIEIPYTTVSQNGTQTEFKEAVLELKVIPQITPTGSVIMSLNIKRDSQGQAVTTGGQNTTAIDKREVETMVQVEDGETVVLGGVYESDAVTSVSTIPWVSDLPIVGWMFKKTVKDEAKRELLVFITPKVIKDSLTTN
ncbi:type IV pilus secretin PilQ [Methylomonas sp. LL1]|uniref:type IV pilus secretin family protein n=1 Tax=Methylomonas sp. LL1 TaxID=2785785 RepID=UPI0018C41380|nr:type IV pilus secretin family protein [Methylomonas sp. LL1]QPK62531.1 type IV pilus secretin PilQ [Methylomonas sp. LL1]